MEKCGLWQDILGARNLVAYHVDSLIHFVNNNCVENYNSVVAKYVGGKRINFSLKGKTYVLKNKFIVIKYLILFKYNIGSYQARCHSAVNSYNLGPSYMSYFHKKVTLHSPGFFTKKYIRMQHRRNEIKKNKLQRSQSGYITLNYLCVQNCDFYESLS